MSNKKKIIILILSLSMIVSFCGGFYLLYSDTIEPKAKLYICGILSFAVMGCIGNYLYFRWKYISFSKRVCSYAEEIMNGNPCAEVKNQESLTSKMVMEMQKMSRILEVKASEANSEKNEIQQMVSDIAHQLKTPISNIRMYGDTLLEDDLNREDEVYFIQVLQHQILKLEFLIDSLVKMSRLESNMIHLHPEYHNIFQTIALAMSTVTGKAEAKKIELSVNCKPTLRIKHDVKWTAEALENILDNAIKYTPKQGAISVNVQALEMYIEIQIKDTGIGIDPNHFNDIFKRFYREKEVVKTEGLGIGLYLARHIVTQQDGYIMVKSKLGTGSTFSVFLPTKAA